MKKRNFNFKRHRWRYDVLCLTYTLMMNTEMCWYIS